MGLVAPVCGAAGVITGLAVLSGWLFEIEQLKLHIGGTAVKVNAAPSFIMIGLSLLSEHLPARSRTPAVGTFAGVAALLGTAIIWQYLLGCEMQWTLSSRL